MDIELINKCFELKDLIHNLKEYKDAIDSELKMENDDEVKLLSYYKDLAIMDYEDNLKHFSKNSKEVLESSKVLSNRIYELNNHPLVKDYKEKLDKLNKIYNEIDKELFGDIDA
ncbi:MAG: YlbF family regulator [Firmicutes bacterium]|uniref:YlbF family regulator n=1 Tax=Candidatus Onthovivens merdipullorum TaxID=2840889 RepID=A0A9D9GY05_9BACL|nr:YlbF family regulator [Candidatus Onthovivens merdipullorum]